MATIVTQQAGDWNTASTWAGGTIPGENDTVWITEPVTFSTSITGSRCRTRGRPPSRG